MTQHFPAIDKFLDSSMFSLLYSTNTHLLNPDPSRSGKQGIYTVGKETEMAESGTLFVFFTLQKHNDLFLL